MWENLDDYCERLDHGLWAEPVNAVTNLAFIVAAFLCWKTLAKLSRVSASDYYLIALLFSIGVGSGLFHTFATGWAKLADIIPIVVFQLFYLWLYSRNVIELSWNRSALLMSGFLVILAGGFMLNLRLAPWLDEIGLPLNGSGMYAGALVGVYCLGLYHILNQAKLRFSLFIAAGLFTLSLLFRTLDMAICSSFPLGTHFLWHLCNAAVLYLSLMVYLHSR